MLTLRGWQGSARASSGWSLVLVALVTCVACGDDASDSESKSEAGAGGKSANGSSDSSGGSGGHNTMLPRMTARDQTDSAYTCRPKPEDSGGVGSKGSRCCAGTGVCTGDLSDGFLHGFPLDTCSAESELRCLPNMRNVSVGDEDAGTSAGFATCRVRFPGAPADFPDYEGRCLPACFARQNPIAARLSQATCAAGELCAPCYDPLTGKSTGSCELYGDAPAEPASEAFGECADGLGYCVPSFAAGMQASQLMQLSCADGELCGPKNKVADPGACFEHCDAGSYGPGACVPTFLASFVAGFLAQGDCEPSMVCGPCSLFGMRTGICD